METIPSPEPSPGQRTDDSLFIPHEEVCAVLGCARSTLKMMLAAGSIPAIHPGKDYRIPRVAFYEAVNELARVEAAKKRAVVAAQTATAQAPVHEKRGRGRPRRKLPDDWLTR